MKIKIGRRVRFSIRSPYPRQLQLPNSQHRRVWPLKNVATATVATMFSVFVGIGEAALGWTEAVEGTPLLTVGLCDDMPVWQQGFALTAILAEEGLLP